MTILVLIETVFMIIWEILTLNSMLLLLLVNIGSSSQISVQVSLISMVCGCFLLLPQFIQIFFFRLYQQNKSSESKVKFIQASNCYEKVLEAAKLAYNNTKESIFSQKLGSWGFWQIINCVFNKVKSALHPLFNGAEVLSSASDKAKLFAKNVSKNSNLNDSAFYLPVFFSRTNLKLHNTSVTPKIFEKVITSFDSPKTVGLDFIPMWF